MRTIAVDFETYYSRKLKYSVKTMIAERFVQHPAFDAYLVSVCDGEQTWVGHPKDLNWESLSGTLLLSHNAYFDHSVYDALVKRGEAPKIELAGWYCTANLTSYLCNRRSLDAAVQYLLGIAVDKGLRDDMDGMKFENLNPAMQKAFKGYARNDAWLCWRLYNKFSNRWPEIERHLSDLTIRQGMHGVQINTGLLDHYLLRSHEVMRNTEALLPWLSYVDEGIEGDSESWDNFNTKPTSTKCIAEQCRRSGIPSPPVKSEDEEAYEAWETQHSPKHPWIKALGNWRSINKLYKTFEEVKKRLRDDGTMPFGLKYFGAHTGRWAGDAKINMQNMRKRPVLVSQDGLIETDEARVNAALLEHDRSQEWPGWVQEAIDFRSLIIPRPGKKMIVSDLSQIEPRVLAWLAGDFDFLDRLRGGMSVYEAHARGTMGWTGGVLKNENKEAYNLAKVRVLALGYGAGWKKLISMAQSMAGMDITKDDPEFVDVENPFTKEVKRISGYGENSRRIVKEFRGSNTKITALWRKLDDAIKQSIGGDFSMTLPSGRKMNYESVRFECRIEPDPDTGKPIRKNVVTAGVGGRRFQWYGGKLTENIVQAVARDVFATHVSRLDKAGLPVLFTVHDEAVLEVDSSVKACDIEREMSFCPEWISGLPVAAEAHEADCYFK